MDLMLEWELVGRLVLAAFLGFVIGLEREWAGQPAGERTHALASLGAATFAVISAKAFPGGDTARVARLLDLAATRNPANRQVHKVRADLYLSQGRAEEALAETARFRATNPQ